MKKILITILVLIGLSGIVFGQYTCANIGCTPNDSEEGDALCSQIQYEQGFENVICNKCVSGIPTPNSPNEPTALGHCENELEPNAEIPEINSTGIVAIIALAGIAGFMILKKR